MKKRIEVDELFPEYILMPHTGSNLDVEVPESLVIRYEKASKAYYAIQAELKEIYEADLNKGEEEE